MNASMISDQVPNDLEVGFHFEGTWIENPFASEGMMPVTPAYYGFRVCNMGGGCKAWELIVDADEEEEFILYDGDGTSAPDTPFNGWLLIKSINDILVWEVRVRADGTGEVIRHPGPLTVEEAAHVALRYAETLLDIDQGEHTPDLADDLNRIRAALGEPQKIFKQEGA